MKQICLQVDSAYAGERIDKYLAEVMSDYSRSFLQKQLKDGNVIVNGKRAKASLKVAEDDEVCISIPENKETKRNGGSSKCRSLFPDFSKCPNVSL